MIHSRSVCSYCAKFILSFFGVIHLFSAVTVQKMIWSLIRVTHLLSAVSVQKLFYPLESLTCSLQLLYTYILSLFRVTHLLSAVTVQKLFYPFFKVNCLQLFYPYLVSLPCCLQLSKKYVILIQSHSPAVCSYCSKNILSLFRVTHLLSPVTVQKMILSINKKGNFESIQIKAQFSLQTDKSLCCTPPALYMKTKRALSCWVQSMFGVLQWTDSMQSAQARSCRQSVPRVPGWGAASLATSCQVSQHFSWRCCWSTSNAG